MEEPYSFLPGRGYLIERFRPWKLATLGVAMLWLLYGAHTYRIPDWDVGISVLMAGLTYLCAPWSAATLGNALRYRPPGCLLHVLAALLLALFIVDWVYWTYHMALGNQMYRLDNFKSSFALYFLGGTVWMYPGSVGDFIRNLRALRKPAE